MEKPKKKEVSSLVETDTVPSIYTDVNSNSVTGHYIHIAPNKIEFVTVNAGDIIKWSNKKIVLKNVYNKDNTRIIKINDKALRNIKLSLNSANDALKSIVIKKESRDGGNV